jgi:hypothetical protein
MSSPRIWVLFQIRESMGAFEFEKILVVSSDLKLIIDYIDQDGEFTRPENYKDYIRYHYDLYKVGKKEQAEELYKDNKVEQEEFIKKELEFFSVMFAQPKDKDDMSGDALWLGLVPLLEKKQGGKRKKTLKK